MVSAEMLDKAAAELYGGTREQAKEWAKLDKFESALWQVKQILDVLGIDYEGSP